MERIRLEVSWDAPDGTLDDLENEGDGDAGGLLMAAFNQHMEGGGLAWFNATREEV